MLRDCGRLFGVTWDDGRLLLQVVADRLSGRRDEARVKCLDEFAKELGARLKLVDDGHRLKESYDELDDALRGLIDAASVSATD